MFSTLFFILSATLTIGGSLLVATTQNLLHACVFLLGSLFGVAGLYATLGADFLAAIQIIVYAGGVVILMLFAVMLTGGRERKKNRFGLRKIASMGNRWTYATAVLSAAVLGSLIFKMIEGMSLEENKNIKIGVDEIGIALVTDHILIFEISSIVLLGALIGGTVISRPWRQER